MLVFFLQENIGCDRGNRNADNAAIVSECLTSATNTEIGIVREEDVAVEKSLAPFAAASIGEKPKRHDEVMVHLASGTCGMAPVSAAPIAEIEFDHFHEHRTDNFANRAMESSSNLSNDVQVNIINLVMLFQILFY